MQTGRTPPYLTHNRILTWEVAETRRTLCRCPSSPFLLLRPPAAKAGIEIAISIESAKRVSLPPFGSKIDSFFRSRDHGRCTLRGDPRRTARPMIYLSLSLSHSELRSLHRGDAKWEHGRGSRSRALKFTTFSRGGSYSEDTQAWISSCARTIPREDSTFPSSNASSSPADDVSTSNAMTFRRHGTKLRR